MTADLLGPRAVERERRDERGVGNRPRRECRHVDRRELRAAVGERARIEHRQQQVAERVVIELELRQERTELDLSHLVQQVEEGERAELLLGQSTDRTRQRVAEHLSGHVDAERRFERGDVDVAEQRAERGHRRVSLRSGEIVDRQVTGQPSRR